MTKESSSMARLSQTKIAANLAMPSRESAEAALDALLRERARKLAQSVQADAATPLHRVIAVRRGRAVWGLLNPAVKEVRRVRICALPHTPPTITGLFHVRGRAFCALDLQPLVGAPAPLEHDEECLVAMLEGPEGRAGLRIDEVLGAREVFAEDLRPGLDDGALEFVIAVTKDLTSIIDVPRLLSRPEFTMVER
jgi:chemotaxis signal transduction protein